jgi:hypothetical protein
MVENYSANFDKRGQGTLISPDRFENQSKITFRKKIRILPGSD